MNYVDIICDKIMHLNGSITSAYSSKIVMYAGMYGKKNNANPLTP